MSKVLLLIFWFVSFARSGQYPESDYLSQVDIDDLTTDYPNCTGINHRELRS